MQNKPNLELLVYGWLTFPPGFYRINSIMLSPFGYIAPWWIWVALVILFAVIEACTWYLVTIWFAAAALVMVFLSFLKIPLPVQAFVFLGISAALLVFTRPLAVKKLKMGREKTNVDSLIGKYALVTKTIGEFKAGQAKINGQIWTARSEDGVEIAEGVKCTVLRIEGVHLIVCKLEEVSK
jgi:membrane protein implicated in regulation of membrane protease activity